MWWKCSKCGNYVEYPEIICPICGTPQLKENDVDFSPERVSSAEEKESISSGVYGWVVFLIVLAIIYLICAVILFIASSNSYSNRDKYVLIAFGCIGIGIASLCLSSLIKGFGYVIKAAKLYLMKNREKLEREQELSND